LDGGRQPSDAELLRVIQGADLEAARAAFAKLWGRSAGTIARFVRTEVRQADESKSGLGGMWKHPWAKRPHRIKT
jgi:hypothetical protein